MAMEVLSRRELLLRANAAGGALVVGRRRPALRCAARAARGAAAAQGDRHRRAIPAIPSTAAEAPSPATRTSGTRSSSST